MNEPNTPSVQRLRDNYFVSMPLTARLICDKSQLRCTSIAVIHQPRWKTLACFDQVVLLATSGYLVYSGPVPNSVAYFTQSLRMKVSEGDNPADLFLDFIGGEERRDLGTACQLVNMLCP